MNQTLPELTHLISELKTYTTSHAAAPVLLERDLLAALAKSGNTLTNGELDHHMLNDLLGQAMILRGFTNQRDGTYLENIPEFRHSHADRNQRAHTYRKEIYPLTYPLKTITLGEVPVHAPTCIVDENADTIIAIQMIGPEQSVKSNWAALVGGGRANWLNNCVVKLRGSKNHHTIRHNLSTSGWTEYWLIHHQASFETAVPDKPIYLIHHNPQNPIPASFYQMLVKALAVPTRPAWKEYLWVNGRYQNLIQLIPRADCRGSLAWKIRPTETTWNKIITTGLQENHIAF